MIGLVIVTHGRLAEEFIAVMEHVTGPQERVAAVCIGPGDDIEGKRREILQRVGQVDGGAGVLVLTDMFGGTPSNLAISISGGARVEVVAGLNVPMLITLAQARRGNDLHAAALAAQEAGRRHIHAAAALLKKTG
jgi:PTS system mannose-specific IIA component